MADAAKVYEAFGQKQEAAIHHVLEEVRSGQKTMDQGMKDLGDEVYGLYEYLSRQEKANLYGLNTPLDIKELGEEEKRFLVAALYQLAADKAPNEEQQNYLRAVQKYLDIRNPQLGGDILERVESIEDLQAQKAILQTVLEYLCLQGGDSYDETELQQDFLDSFSVNKRQYQEICSHVELLYRATGAVGLSEKYGFIPETEVLAPQKEGSDEIDDEVAKELLGSIESGVLDPLVKTEEPKQNTSDDEECYGVFMSMLYGYSVWAAVRMRGNVVKLIDVDFYNLPEKRIEDLTELEKSAIIYNFNFRPIKHANGDIVKYKTLKEAIRDLHQRNGMRDWEIERKSPVSEGSDPLNPPYRDKWRKRGNHPYKDGTPRWEAWYHADPQNAADYRAYTRACGNTSNIPTLEVPYSE